MSLLASALTDWIAAFAAGLTAGFASAAVWQLVHIKRQTALSALANVSQSYGQVTQSMAALRSGLFKHADDLFGDDDRLKPELVRICDEILEFADVLVEQRNTIPGAEMDWSTWDSYLRFIYQQSPVLKRYVKESLAFYPDYVLSIFGHVIVRDELTGAVRSQWSVDEWDRDRDYGPDRELLEAAVTKVTGERAASDAGSNSYPWFRTWVITRISEETGDRDARLVAATRPAASDPETADVGFVWCEPASSEAEKAMRKKAEPVLHSWVLVVLRASSVLKKARVVFDPSSDPLDVWLEDANTWRRRLVERRKPPRERYLAPVLSPLRQGRDATQ